MAERIRVFVRIRPNAEREQKHDSSDDINEPQSNFEYNLEENQFRLKNKIYTIDTILSQSTQQIDVYQKVATEQINSFLQGFNTTLFAYGQTGSGKTHTIFGPDITHFVPSKCIISSPNSSPSNKRINKSPHDHIKSLFGLVPRCFITVFQRLNDSKNIKKHQLDLSCVEVYNTTLRDLFQPSNSKNLKIREDYKSKCFFVENLTKETIQTQQELMLFIKRIQLNRAVSSTNMNKTSSRSHVLLQLRLIQQLLTGETKESLLTFVDLAGSEMVKKTGTHGNSLKEAGYINASLTVLSRVIESLGLQHSTKNKKIGHTHIPFRDSSLTKLLKNALGGNCKTTLVVCVSSDLRHKEETHSSLRFATRAACIKNEPVINKALDANELYKENVKLKIEIEKLQMIINGEKDEIIQQKLKHDLDIKEQEIEELKSMVEELNIKLQQTVNKNNLSMTQIGFIENENQNLNQTINELEIELSREKHSKNDIEKKYIDMQVTFSEVASQKLFDDFSDAEVESYRKCNEFVDDENIPDVTKKVILDGIRFRKSMQKELAPDNKNKEFREMFIKYLPMNVIQQQIDKNQREVDDKYNDRIMEEEEEEDDGKNDRNDTNKEIESSNVNPMHLIEICKAMNDKIESLEIELQEANIRNMEHEYQNDSLNFVYQNNTPPESSIIMNPKSRLIELNVIDIEFIDNELRPIVSTYDSIDTTTTEYGQLNSSDGELTKQSPNNNDDHQSYHVYKNESGTEVSFEPLPLDQLTISDEIINEKRINVVIEPDDDVIDVIELAEEKNEIDRKNTEKNEKSKSNSSDMKATNTMIIQTNIKHFNNAQTQTHNEIIEQLDVPKADTGCTACIIQ